jgi:anthranilate 1,2-dioxygenase ferredoxin component
MQVSWQKVCSVADFPEDGKVGIHLGEWHVLVVKLDDQYFAYNDCCTHQAARLSEGRIRRGSLMCPLHGARFEISTGRCMGGSYASLLAMPVRNVDGFIEVDIPARDPSPEERPV